MIKLLKMNESSGVTLALFLALGVPSTLPAQKDSTRQLARIKSSGEEVRQSYERRDADGLKVTVYQVRTNGLFPVNSGQLFTSGDRVKVKFQSNFDGYIYVINLTPSGERRLLFPRPLSRRNSVGAGQTYDIPPSGEFQFDKDPGLEVLQIVMSRSQVSFLEAILDRASQKAGNLPLDRVALNSLRDLTGKPARIQGSGIATQTQKKRTAGLQTRILTLDSRKEGSILVLSGAKGTNRFGPGEISVFEIRLNHY